METIEQQVTAPENAEIEVEQQPGTTTMPEIEETDEQKNARIQAEEAQKRDQKEAKRRESVQRRIDELTADKYAERKRSDELAEQNRRLLEQLNTGNRQAPNASAGEAPKRENFDSYEEYIRADAAYVADQKVAAALEKFTKTQTESQNKAREEQSSRAAERAFIERRAAVEKQYPDFQEVTGDWRPQLPNSVVDMIVRVPEGPLVTYHMAKNPELERAFREQPEYMHGIILGQLIAQLKAPSKTSEAPPPGKPVATRSVANDGDFNGKPEDYYAWAMKQQKAGKLR